MGAGVLGLRGSELTDDRRRVSGEGCPVEEGDGDSLEWSEMGGITDGGWKIKEGNAVQMLTRGSGGRQPSRRWRLGRGQG
jgi:hypothetical protein